MNKGHITLSSPCGGCKTALYAIPKPCGNYKIMLSC